MITEKQYEQMLDALVSQLIANNGIAYTARERGRDAWFALARSMLNSILIIGGIIVLGDDHENTRNLPS